MMAYRLRDPIDEVGDDRFRQILQAWEAGVADEPTVLSIAVDQVEGMPWMVVGGIGQMVRATENIRLQGKGIARLRATGEFPEAFLEFLRPLRFALDIFAVSEGEVVLPGTPVVQIYARRVDCLLFGDFARSSVEEGSLAASIAWSCRHRARGLSLFLAPGDKERRERLVHSAKGCRIAGWAGTSSEEASLCAGLTLLKDSEGRDYNKKGGARRTLSILSAEPPAVLAEKIGESSAEGMDLFLEVSHLETLGRVASLAEHLRQKISGILLDPLELEDGAGLLRWSHGMVSGAETPGSGTLRIVRVLNEQGLAEGDRVFSAEEELPAGSRPLLERYTDRGRTCRPLPEPARSEVLLARAQDELAEIEDFSSGYPLQWSERAEDQLKGRK